MAQTIIGLFGKKSQAQKAVTELRKVGFDDADIIVADKVSRTVEDAFRTTGVPSQDQQFYLDGIRQGDTLVMVRSDGQQAKQAADILSGHDVVDVDERMAGYRKAGRTDVDLSDLDDAGNVLQVIEEDLQVGKRQVQRGGVRIHTVVSERPVEEQVTLREERVSVDRRPVDREVPADADAFQEQTFEVSESAEEAVVSKQARVVEEVVVNKDVQEHTETVRDTVRRQDVEVDDVAAADTQSMVDDSDTGDQAFYEQHYASTGSDYASYQPVFAYGRNLATTDRYHGKAWNDIEADAQRDWETSNPGTWEQFKAGIRDAWERASHRR